MSPQAKLITILQATKPALIIGVPLTSENTLVLDLGSNNEALSSVDLHDTEAFSRCVFNQMKNAGADFGAGGYLEDRIIYKRSEMFENEEMSRSIHLGIDVWAEANTPVYAPLDASVHVVHDNAGFSNYGPTIILRHEIDGHPFYTLYGHLSMDSLNLEIGTVLKAGDQFCKIGNFPTNGDWPPHLHFQIIDDQIGAQLDYTGVCATSDVEFYSQRCPDPNLILGLDFL